LRCGHCCWSLGEKREKGEVRKCRMTKSSSRFWE
jgi:hypothetical protein